MWVQVNGGAVWVEDAGNTPASPHPHIEAEVKPKSKK